MTHSNNGHLCKPMVYIVEDIPIEYLIGFVDHGIYRIVRSFVKLQRTLLLLQNTFFNVLVCFQLH